MSFDRKVESGGFKITQQSLRKNADPITVMQHVRTAKLDDLLFFIGYPNEEVRSIVWWRLTYPYGE